MSQFSDKILTIAAIYVKQYQAKPEETLMMLNNCVVPLEIMNMTYNLLTRTKEMNTLESLDQEVKEKIWITTLGLMGEWVLKEKAVRLCKAIWTINFILEK